MILLPNSVARPGEFKLQRPAESILDVYVTAICFHVWLLLPAAEEPVPELLQACMGIERAHEAASFHARREV